MSFKPKQTNLNNLKHVEVLDVLMGSGKTYASLRHIEGMALSNKQVKWVFSTEFLSEIATRTYINDVGVHKKLVRAELKSKIIKLQEELAKL